MTTTLENDKQADAVVTGCLVAFASAAEARSA
jgi:hypothetical protein